MQRPRRRTGPRDVFCVNRSKPRGERHLDREGGLERKKAHWGGNLRKALAVSIATLPLTVVPLVSVELVTDAAQELVVPLRVVLLVSEWPR